MGANITAEGAVERCFRNDDNTKLIVAVEDGGKYPTRLTVFVDGTVDVQEGDIVTVTSNRLPYVKERTYTDRDGNAKVAKDLILPAATVGAQTGASASAETFGEDVPF